jgi:hypothetical protein
MASGLSPELECRLDQLLSAVVERLAVWGYDCNPLESAANA